eukprot:gene4171-5316_t
MLDHEHWQYSCAYWGEGVTTLGQAQEAKLKHIAKKLNLSKSGVFSRVGSREGLQRAVMAEFERRFQQDVLLPALREPRGLPRLDTMMKAWLERVCRAGPRGSCLYVAGAFEFDDRDGPMRELLLEGVQRWRSVLRRSILQAKDCGHLKADTEVEQLVFELDALFTGLLREARFLRNPEVMARGLAAYERLISHYRPTGA